MRTAYILIFLPALAGVVLGAISYFAPNAPSGVEGTPGALLALIGAAAVALGALLGMLSAVRGWGLRLLNILLGIGALLTATASYFLMQYPFAVAMALAFVGLVAAIAFRTSRGLA